MSRKAVNIKVFVTLTRVEVETDKDSGQETAVVTLLARRDDDEAGQEYRLGVGDTLTMNLNLIPDTPE